MNLTIKHGLLDLSDKGLKDLSILKEVENPHTCKKLKLNNNYEISFIENIEQFENLEELNLGRNKIKKIENIGNLSNLKELFLYGNQIEVIENIGALKNLKKLILDINIIREISGLTNLEKLETLSLVKNKIARIYGLESLNSLKKINLDGNPIQEITGIGNLKNIIELRIHNNNMNPDLLNILGGVSSNGVVQNIEKVKAYCRNEFVIVDGNIIFAETFPEFGGLGLYIAFKEIVDIKSIKNLENIHNLKGLYLFRNKIKEINGLESLTELKHLDLSSNDISSIKGLDAIENLRILKINNNYITKIENLEQLTKLEILELKNNKIKEIDNLNTLKNLEILDLGYNQISIIYRLNHLEHLERLLLQNNNINRIENLNSQKKLKKLDLSSNNIIKIEGSELPINLFKLSLSNNLVEVIDGLQSNNALIDLDLSDNQIIKFSGLENLTNLEVLNLDGNGLIQDIITRIKEISNKNTFSKYCVGYCLLRKVLIILNEDREGIINFENSSQEFQFLLRFKYSEIQPILKLLTDQYLEFQVGRNDFIISIITPIYGANLLDRMLKKIEPEGSYRFRKYEFLQSELKLKNIKIVEKLIKFIEEDELCEISFARTSDGIIRTKENNLVENNLEEFFEKFFWKPTVEIAETRIFKNESGLHTHLLEKIKTELNKYQIIDLHNLRDEISIDLLFKCRKFNWKIGISVEATSDIAEIKKDKRNISFPKTIKAKMKDVDRISDLDLFIILFCIDLTVKSYKDTLRITIAELEKIDDPKVIYIPPENLVDFFKPLIPDSNN